MPAAKKRSSSGKPAWSAFQVHWWLSGEDEHVYRYRTKGPEDIREIYASHIEVKVHPRLVPD